MGRTFGGRWLRGRSRVAEVWRRDVKGGGRGNIGWEVVKGQLHGG